MSAKLIDIQQKISRSVFAEIADDYGIISRQLTTNVLEKSATNPKGHEAILIYRQYNLHLTPELAERSIAALEYAVDGNVNFAHGWGMLSMLYYDTFAYRFFPMPEAFAKAEDAAERAIALDRTSASANSAMALISLYRRDLAIVRRHCERIVDLHPNAVWSIAHSGWLIALSGDWDRGLKLLRQSASLNAYYPGFLHSAPFFKHYFSGDYDRAYSEAIDFAMPDHYWDPLLRAAVLGQLGKHAEARGRMKQALEMKPSFTTDYDHFLRCYITRDDWTEHFLDGLKKAGFQPAQKPPHRRLTSHRHPRCSK